MDKEIRKVKEQILQMDMCVVIAMVSVHIQQWSLQTSSLLATNEEVHLVRMPCLVAEV